MTGSPIPRSVATTGNLRVVFVPEGGGDPLGGTTLQAASDVTYSLTSDGYAAAIAESGVTSSRLGGRQVFSARGSFGEDLALEYVFGDPNDVAQPDFLPGTRGALVVRRGIPNETDWAAGQKVTVHTVECGTQILQPPDENGIDRIKQSLYTTDLTQYLATVRTVTVSRTGALVVVSGDGVQTGALIRFLTATQSGALVALGS